MNAEYGNFLNKSEYDIRVCLDNVSRLQAEYASTDGRLSAHISEFTRAMLHLAQKREAELARSAYDKSREERRVPPRTPSADTLRAIYREFCPFAEVKNDAPRTAVTDAEAYRENYNLLLRKLICTHLYLDLKDKGGEFSTDALLGSLISPARGVSVAYLQNAYSDEAFAEFSSYLCAEEDEQPSKLLCEDMHSVCDEVSAGNSSYCILPLENISEGRLGGARRLIHEYDLKIAHTVTLRSKGIVFALLRKTLCRLGVAKNGPLYYEFSLSGRNKKIGQILSVAEALGLSVHKIDTAPLSYSDSEYRFDIILCCPTESSDSEDRLIPFILYLILEAPDHSSVGLYRATERLSHGNA